MRICTFYDGNGRTGRLILFRECLKHNMIPIVIEDIYRNEYLEGLQEYRKRQELSKLVNLFEKEQKIYYEKCRYFME